MTVRESDWQRYIDRMSRINGRAGELMRKWLEKHGTADREAMIAYANALVMKYGEASGELACQMYEAQAVAQGVIVAAAEMAELPSYGTVARAVNGALKQGAGNVPRAVERQVKQVGADISEWGPRRNPAERFRWGEDEQRNGRSLSRRLGMRDVEFVRTSRTPAGTTPSLPGFPMGTAAPSA